jgi:hypothetical protein
MVRPIDRAFEQAPGVFQSVRVDIPANIGFSVIDNFMDVVFLFQSLIRFQGISLDGRAGSHVALDFFPKQSLAHSLYRLGAYRSMTFAQSHDSTFAN